MNYNDYMAKTLGMVAEGISKLNEVAGITKEEDSHDCRGGFEDSCGVCDNIETI